MKFVLGFILFLIIIFCILEAISLIGYFICDLALKSTKKKIYQVKSVRDALDSGAAFDDVIKLPMPRKLRKELKEIHKKYERIC